MFNSNKCKILKIHAKLNKSCCGQRMGQLSSELSLSSCSLDVCSRPGRLGSSCVFVIFEAVPAFRKARTIEFLTLCPHQKCLSSLASIEWVCCLNGWKIAELSFAPLWHPWRLREAWKQSTRTDNRQLPCTRATLVNDFWAVLHCAACYSHDRQQLTCLPSHQGLRTIFGQATTWKNWTETAYSWTSLVRTPFVMLLEKGSLQKLFWCVGPDAKQPLSGCTQKISVDCTIAIHPLTVRGKEAWRRIRIRHNTRTIKFFRGPQLPPLAWTLLRLPFHFSHIRGVSSWVHTRYLHTKSYILYQFVMWHIVQTLN